MDELNSGHPPMFSRARNDDRDTTELRVEIPKSIMGVIDAHWMARGSTKASRSQVVNEILQEWAERKWQEASLVLQLVPEDPGAGQAEASPG